MAQGLQGLNETGRSDYGYEQYGAGMSFGEYLEQLGKLGSRTVQNLAGYAYDLPRDAYSLAAGGIVNPMRQVLSAGEAEPIPTDLYPSYFEQQQPGVAQAGLGGYQDPVGPGEQAADYLTPMVDIAFDPLAKVAGAAAGLAGLSRLTKAAHGSPHVFDEFSMSKMGTGEGAQAYGHGLYFADVDPSTAKSAVATQYRKGLADPETFPTLEGRDLGEYMNDLYNKAATVPIKEAQKYYDRAALIEIMERDWDIDDAIEYAKDTDYGEEAISWLEGIKARGSFKAPGALYNVDLTPDADDWLDWDAPLGEQSAKVREALEGTKLENIYTFDGLNIDEITDIPTVRVKLQRMMDRNGGDYEAAIEEMRGLGGTAQWQQGIDDMVARTGYEPYLTVNRATPEKMTGERIYSRLTDQLGSRKAASEYLDSIGIPGHKYFDQMSRSEGAGTRNYVVYNDDYIDITHRDGKPVTNKREALEASRNEP